MLLQLALPSSWQIYCNDPKNAPNKSHAKNIFSKPFFIVELSYP